MIRFVFRKVVDTVFLFGHFDRCSTDLPIVFKTVVQRLNTFGWQRLGVTPDCSSMILKIIMMYFSFLLAFINDYSLLGIQVMYQE